jgi:hypothetical protein
MRAWLALLLGLLAAAGSFGQTRAELQARAAELRAQIVTLQADAEAMATRRAGVLAVVASLETEVSAVAAQIAALPPERSDVMRYWYTSDDGDGPSRSDWSRHLRIAWANPNGDWRDAGGVAQGAVPAATATVTAVGPLVVNFPDVRAVHKGILLRLGGKNHPYATFAGRLSATPPTLVVQLVDGTTRTLPVLSLAGWNTSTYTGLDTRQSARLSAGTGSVLALFDIPPDAVSGALHLQVIARSYTGALSAYALDPPGIMYPREHAPVLGIAATVADENALKAHPSVIRAGDFDLRRNSKAGGTFDGIQQAPHAPQEYLADPLDPTRIIYRSGFKARDGTAKGDQEWRGSLTATISTTPADLTDPKRAIKQPATKELFARLCFLLEDDWRARNDGNKLGIGWDLRYGWWTQGNYWQQTHGNGGTPGTGLKVVRTAKPGTGQWQYEGHSIRMEAGKGPSDPNHPHDALRPVESYTYNLDQAGFNGNVFRHGRAVIERGRWHCVEQQIKVNSIVGPYDALGNGQAVADGVLRTWFDGVLIAERTDLRWHRHPEMGVEGPWVNWYFGGKKASEVAMHYRMADLVLATEYIGLPRNFAQRNAANDSAYQRTGTR